MNHGFSLEKKDRGYGKQYLGKYKAKVTNISDPLKMGRIKANCPRVLGPNGESGWALPCMPPGFKRIPKVGDFVWLEFEAGDVESPIWVGVWFTEGAFEIEDDTPKVNDREILTELDDHQEELEDHDSQLDSLKSRVSALESRSHSH